MEKRDAVMLLVLTLFIMLCKDWRPRCNYQKCANYENGRCKSIKRRKTRGFDNCYEDNEK